MIIETILVIIAVCIIGLIVNCFGVGDRKPKFDTISIREAMDLCNLPVVTFTNNGKKFNFLFDTGATESHISESAIELMEFKESDSTLNVQGFTGSAEACGAKIVELGYKERKFPVELFVSSALDKAFAEIKQNLGVQIHGILGNIFFRDYGYVCDFDGLIIYSKK